MNYFIWEDLQAKYKLTGKDWQATDISSTWAPLACADIDAMLSPKYTVPFTPTPLFVKNLAMDMAYWQMTYREDPQDKLKEYIDERVTGILNGTITLTDPTTGAPIAASPTVFLTTSGTLSSFGIDHVENFAVDSNWQQSYRSERGQF